MAASYFLTPLFLINCSPTPKTLNPPRKADLRRGMKLFEPYQDFAKRYEHCAKPSARRGWKKPGIGLAAFSEYLLRMLGPGLQLVFQTGKGSKRVLEGFYTSTTRLLLALQVDTNNHRNIAGSVLGLRTYCVGVQGV